MQIRPCSLPFLKIMSYSMSYLAIVANAQHRWNFVSSWYYHANILVKESHLIKKLHLKVGPRYIMIFTSLVWRIFASLFYISIMMFYVYYPSNSLWHDKTMVKCHHNYRSIFMFKQYMLRNLNVKGCCSLEDDLRGK